MYPIRIPKKSNVFFIISFYKQLQIFARRKPKKKGRLRIPLVANFLVEFRHSTQVVPQHVGVRASFSIGPSKPGLQSTVSSIIFSFKKTIFKEFHYYYHYSPFFLAHCAISNFLEHPISQFKQNGVLIKKQQWRIYFESCSRILK